MLVRDFVSLNGTIVNCAGGPTPWHSWLSCEESTEGLQAGWAREHGYVFEVPIAATGPVQAMPIRAMGRFVHEAVALDPRSGIVYQTEDRGAGFYRYRPLRPENRSVYFHATGGGDAGLGKVWRYRPDDAVLVLAFESPGIDVLGAPDNLTVSPRGGILICEDRGGAIHLRGLAPDGRVFPFARNVVSTDEFAGPCFSPDGRTLFVNIQGTTRSGESGTPGMNLAIWGPWERAAL